MRTRKINSKKVKELAEMGVIPSDIARNQGVAVSTITRYLESISSELTAIKRYSGTKADALLLSQVKAATISDLLMDEWLKDPDKYLLSQDMRLQKELLVAVQGVKTYDHNQERLERNQATQIVDYRAVMIELSETHDRLMEVMKQAHQELIELGENPDGIWE